MIAFAQHTTRELWSQTCDHGVHVCRVDRLEDRTGQLTILLAGVGILHQQPVTIANTEHDHQDWRELSAAIIDNPDRWNRAWL